MGLNGLDIKKLDAKSSGLSPRLDTWTTNGIAQSEVILSGHFELLKKHSLGKRNIYLQTWTINGYGRWTV